MGTAVGMTESAYNRYGAGKCESKRCGGISRWWVKTEAEACPNCCWVLLMQRNWHLPLV